MQYTPHELKDKLLKALDEDNNVVDMAGVLAVITILETYPITRDVLEQTRIGRYVNELRKKTNDEQLAKRAKKLVRSWQKLVTPQPDNATVNGDREVGERLIPSHPSVTALQGNGSKPNSPALSQTSLSPAVSSPRNCTPRSSLSKQQLGYKPNTPTLQHANQNVKKKPNTPKLPQNISKPNTPDIPHYSNQGCSPNLSNIDPKDHSTPKSTKTSKVNNSVHKSKTISPECSSEAASEKYSNTSRPQTPVTGVTSSDSVGKLHRNLSQDRLSNLSVSSGVSADNKIPQNLNHSTGENSRTSPNNVMYPDQSLNSKTNIASRKRLRNENHNAIPHKRSHANNGEVGSYKNVVNGAIASDSTVPTSEKSTQNTSKISPSTTQDAKQSLTCRRNVNLAVNMDSQKLMEKSLKTPKVKTTAQLIAELQAKSGSLAIGSSVIRQIECNQIQKESDEPQSVLPPGARPRRRQKNYEIPVDSNTPGKSHVSLSQTKTELVEKFLQSSLTPSSAVDMSPFKYDMSSKSESPQTVHRRDSSIEVDVTDSSGDISFRPAEVNTEEQIDLGDSAFGKSEVKLAESDRTERKPKIQTLEEICSQLPPIDYSIVTLDQDEPEDVDPSELVPNSISNSDVSRLHNDEWNAVNGCYDVSGAWRNWTQTHTALSYDSDPLYVLPYVLIDD